MQQLYIFGMGFSTFVHSVQLYCEEKGLVYQSGMEINGRKVILHDETHYDLHPFGKVPVLLHDGHTIIETTTICRYLDMCFPEHSLVPRHLKDRILVDQWSNLLTYYFDSVLIRQYLLEFTFPKGENNCIRHEQINNIEPQVLSLLTQLEQQLGDKAFFIHDHYTMADAILTPMLNYLSKLPHAKRLFSNTPNLLIYLASMKNRASGQKVLSASF